MTRATSGAVRHRKKVRLFRRVKGYRAPHRNRYHLAIEASFRAGVYSFRDRRARKRDFRRLWITRLNAACRERGIRYSQLIAGCKLAQIALDRKMLSELVILDPAAFDAVVALAKKSLDQKSAA